MPAESWDGYAYTALIVFCFLFRKNERGEEEILLIRRANEPYKGETTIPGGRKKRGEALSDACRREMLEETGYTLHDLDFAGILHAYRDGDSREYVSHYYVCRDFEGSLRESDEGELQWVTVENSLSLDGIHPFYTYLIGAVREGRVFDASVHIRVDGRCEYAPL